MDVCTIIAKNYVAQARVLARSFAEHHPDGRCFVLVIDDHEGYIDPETEPFIMLTVEEIECPEFDEMAVRYDVLELSTAVKPWLLAYLLTHGSTSITYLDPDIRIYSSLQSLDQMAIDRGVVLTPHNTKPLPDDGERPGQVDILLAGVYNLGYVSVGKREETLTLLRWWRERLLNDCRVDPLNGYFVDQRWFDLAPGLVSDHAVMRESQYNLAYWNLHSRRLRTDGPSYVVDEARLAFFHFSGFDPAVPGVLSRHQTRIRTETGTALERICQEYAAEVMAAGYEQAREWPYTYDFIACGVKFNRRLRQLYSVAAENGEVDGSPFTRAGSDSFLRWLAVPPHGAGPGLNRVLADLHGTRVDLQAAFPDVGRGDYREFLVWAARSGVVDEPILDLLAPIERERFGLAAPQDLPDDAAVAPSIDAGSRPSDADLRRTPKWGVNVVGYFRSELGTGEAARQVVNALDEAGVDVLPVHGRTVPPNRQGHAFTHLDFTDAHYPVNLICMNADMLGEFAAQAGPSFFDSRYTIGMWFWEVEQFPEIWSSSFDHIDELWLPTDHMVRAISPVSPVPVTKITLPIDMPPGIPISRAELGLPDGFMFLFSFDYHSVFERKNPLATIDAFKQAFEPDDGAVLVVKSINAESAPTEHARLLAAVGGRPDIHVTDGYLSPEVKNAAVAACDCYVSLHRAEGFGFTMAEAMLLDKPVVATGYSGNLDFMSEHNSFLVDYRLVKIGDGAAPYPAGARWAEPDVGHAAKLMRSVFDDRDLARDRGRRGGQEIRETHSPAAAGGIMQRRLALIEERDGDRLNRGAMRHGLSEPLIREVQAGPFDGAQAPFRRSRALARRVVLRLVKPYTAYQQGVNAQIVRSLNVLEVNARATELVSSERHAELLAIARDDRQYRRVWEHIGGLTRSTLALERVVGQTLPQQSAQTADRLNEVAASLRRMQWEDEAIPFMEGSPFSELEHPRVGRVQGYLRDPDADQADTYRSFEDVFRGSEDLIRTRQEVFVNLIGDRAPVLDFGCGRGEFLDLLSERGIDYLGVDSDPGMVRRCREKGHAGVVEADGLDYLDTLEAGALGAIMCAQVIEHLPYEALLRLLSLAREKLDEEGIFIAETVNPHCQSALKTFLGGPHTPASDLSRGRASAMQICGVLLCVHIPPERNRERRARSLHAGRVRRGGRREGGRHRGLGERWQRDRRAKLSRRPRAARQPWKSSIAAAARRRASGTQALVRRRP